MCWTPVKFHFFSVFFSIPEKLTKKEKRLGKREKPDYSRRYVDKQFDITERNKQNDNLNKNSERKIKMDKFCSPYNFTTDWTGTVVLMIFYSGIGNYRVLLLFFKVIEKFLSLRLNNFKSWSVVIKKQYTRAKWS